MTRYPDSIWDLPLEAVGPVIDILDDLDDEGYGQYPDYLLPEVEGTHGVADHHGYDLASTPLDKLFANTAMGFDSAYAMEGARD